MASWVTHLMIADEILNRIPGLHRRGFCIGSIAPDCNVENEDWTAYTPPKAVTHWMKGARKRLSDAEWFCTECIEKRKGQIGSDEEYGFLLGYYAHLLTDAAYEVMARDEVRVRKAWARIRENETLRRVSEGMVEDWGSVKTLITRREINRSILWFEAEYLQNHPESGYLTELLPLKEFPVYLDYLPQGSIVRKIGVMGRVLQKLGTAPQWIAISRDEYEGYVHDVIELVMECFARRNLIAGEGIL